MAVTYSGAAKSYCSFETWKTSQCVSGILPEELNYISHISELIFILISEYPFRPVNRNSASQKAGSSLEKSDPGALTCKHTQFVTTKGANRYLFFLWKWHLFPPKQRAHEGCLAQNLPCLPPQEDHDLPSEFQKCKGVCVLPSSSDPTQVLDTQGLFTGDQGLNQGLSARKVKASPLSSGLSGPPYQGWLHPSNMQDLQKGHLLLECSTWGGN